VNRAQPPVPEPRGTGPFVLVVVVLILALAAAGAGFALAQSQQAAGTTSPTLPTTTTTSGEALATSTTTAATSTSGGEVEPTTAAGGDGGPAITVTKVTTGSGQDTITYFVADVVLASGSTLQAALAGGDLDGTSADTSYLAAAAGAVLAINGDNAADRSDGIIIRNGVIYRDQPARVGLAIYRDGTVEVYDETETSGEELLAAGVWNTYSFGPALLAGGVIGDDLDTVEIEVNPEHGIQGSQPRTGFGYIDAGHYVFVVVDGRSAGYSRGVTLSEFAAIFQDLGCSIAYNLDGGGSSTMYYQGEVVNYPLGRGEERAVGDILYVG
jgi:exopolysaccharide biosynthesis protein